MKKDVKAREIKNSLKKRTKSKGKNGAQQSETEKKITQKKYMDYKKSNAPSPQLHAM